MSTPSSSPFSFLPPSFAAQPTLAITVALLLVSLIIFIIILVACCCCCPNLYSKVCCCCCRRSYSYHHVDGVEGQGGGGLGDHPKDPEEGLFSIEDTGFLEGQEEYLGSDDITQQGLRLEDADDGPARSHEDDEELRFGPPSGHEEFRDGAVIVEMQSLSKFDLTKCLDYTRRFLLKWQSLADTGGTVFHLDVDVFVEQLKTRWTMIDTECVGRVSTDDVRMAVWSNAQGSEKGSLPPEHLPEDLHAIVRSIVEGVGVGPNRLTFSFWDFANYLLRDEEEETSHFVLEAPRKEWAAGE